MKPCAWVTGLQRARSCFSGSRRALHLQNGKWTLACTTFSLSTKRQQARARVCTGSPLTSHGGILSASKVV